MATAKKKKTPRAVRISEFGQRLYKAMRDKDVGVNELGRAIAGNSASISRILTGGHEALSLTNARRAAEFLEVDPAVLAWGWTALDLVLNYARARGTPYSKEIVYLAEKMQRDGKQLDVIGWEKELARIIERVKAIR